MQYIIRNAVWFRKIYGTNNCEIRHVHGVYKAIVQLQHYVCTYT